jgi:hypothetical protein
LIINDKHLKNQILGGSGNKNHSSNNNPNKTNYIVLNDSKGINDNDLNY